MASCRDGCQTLTLLSSARSLPTLPFDLIPEILCRLPVKLLLQLRCVCKSWKSLISDPKFARKHLSVSTTRNLYFVSYSWLCEYLFKSSPLHSVLTNVCPHFTRLEYFANNFDGSYPPDYSRYFIDSCNGILCIGGGRTGLVILWNPSIRKFKELPLFEKPTQTRMMFGFGYDLLRITIRWLLFYITMFVIAKMVIIWFANLK